MRRGRDRRTNARAGARATLLALAFAALACAPTMAAPFAEALAAGQRAQGAGRHDEAAHHYGIAAERAARHKDRDEARYRQAQALARAGRVGEAIRGYERLARESPRGERTPRARLDAALLEIEHGDAARGHAALAELIVAHPESGVSGPALRRRLAHLEATSGDAAALAWLRGVAPRLAGSELDQPVHYEIARALERSGDLEQAREAYLLAARRRPYPRGGLWDDALFRAAELDDRLGHPRRAIETLREMLAVRETSTSVGSYERPRFSSAQLRIAELYRDRLGDRRAARREFYRLYRDHPTSVLRDDALWSAARLARADGDAREACDLVTTLVRELPDSRYARCARLLCPRAPPSGEACAPYIAEDLTVGER